jgi:hypothetical protein
MDGLGLYFTRPLNIEGADARQAGDEVCVSESTKWDWP